MTNTINEKQSETNNNMKPFLRLCRDRCPAISRYISRMIVLVHYYTTTTPVVLLYYYDTTIL